MNPVNDLLQQGISAVRGGNKKEGAQKLAQVVKDDPRNAEAWFWLAAATDDQNEAAACLRRVLKIDPNHSRARQALEVIEQSGGVPESPSFQPSAASPYGAAEPVPQNMRPLNTGELLSGNIGFDTPYGSYSPPPVSRPDAPTRAMPVVNPSTTPPPPFGETTTPPPVISNDPTPPPPFGMPAWANQATAASAAPPPPFGGSEVPPRPPVPDPYATNVPGPGGAVPPPPPFQGGGPGLRFAQLDPAAAQAAAEAQAQPVQPVDPNAELRARLLNNTPGQPPIPPAAQAGGARTFTPDPNLRQAPVKKARNRRAPLYILLAIIVLFLAVVAVIFFLKPGATTTITSDNNTPVATGSPATSATAGATTTGGATTAATTATAAVVTTTAPATTTAAVTTAATTAATTTAAPTTTAATTAATTRPATTTAAPATTSGTTQRPAVTTEVPQPVQFYVRDAGNLMNSLNFVQDNLNRLVVQPYRDGKFKTAPARGTELEVYLMEMGQLARTMKDTRVPEGAFDLGVVANDYANHLSSMTNLIDQYLNTGQNFYMDQALLYFDKATSDRKTWNSVVAAGYPYRVPVADTSNK